VPEVLEPHLASARDFLQSRRTLRQEAIDGNLYLAIDASMESDGNE